MNLFVSLFIIIYTVYIHLFIIYVFNTRSLKINFQRKMPEITKGVSFDTVAREWRCKWSDTEDKASLAAAQVNKTFFFLYFL